MKIRQTIRHWAAKRALTTPGVGGFVRRKLVDLHTDIFLDRADETHREERRAHLDDFFDATMGTYVTALRAGYTEAQAREITHIQANFDFFDHGWSEMMEIPPDELEDHYRRYEAFFEHHDITIDDPLGDFRPTDGIRDAPKTPSKRTDGTFENAVEGFADDVYVETADGLRAGSGESEPTDVAPEDAPGVDDR